MSHKAHYDVSLAFRPSTEIVFSLFQTWCVNNASRQKLLSIARMRQTKIVFCLLPVLSRKRVFLPVEVQKLIMQLPSWEWYINRNKSVSQMQFNQPLAFRY